MTSYNLTEYRPFRPGNGFDLEVHGQVYRPDHPLMQELCDACAHGHLEEFRRLFEGWKNMNPADPPAGPENYLTGTLEPLLYFAIRQHQPQIVSYLLDEGIKISMLAAAEAQESKCDTSIWQAFLDHGWDINRPYGAADPPILAYLFDDEKLVKWFLAHGADPNAEARYGWTPWLRAIVYAPLNIVKLLHAAGGRLDIAVPFTVFGVSNDVNRYPDRMDVLVYLLDSGADINARIWAHNEYGRVSHFDFGSALNRAVKEPSMHHIAEELIRRGARTDIKAGFRSAHKTALDFARTSSPHLVPQLEILRRREIEETGNEAP